MISRKLLAGAILAGSAAAAFAKIDFQRDINPILVEHCYSCHGPKKHKNGLRLDRKADAFLGGDSGIVIIPHQGAESPLFERVSSTDPERRMPFEGDALAPEQVALIKAWIDEGSPWPEDLAAGETGRSTHWAFQPPVRPEIPAVKNRRWVRNPIDRFVLARLEKEKIKPAPEPDRTTLIRRLSFDLLGLPPAPAAAAAFLADQEAGAYERLVDRLLASPHFGERWGRHWLDLARYADSDGYEADDVRPYAYLYRDWVIDAINADLPFDQFTIAQLAGDLLPGATTAQRIATGFHRQTLGNKEDGVDQEEYRNKAVVDRVATTGSVWLGLTIGCAECHSHKYDPIKQREFYQLFAFFNNADDAEVPAPAPADLEKYRAAKSAWDAIWVPLKKSYDEYIRDALPAKQSRWEAAGKIDLAFWDILEPDSAASANGTTLAKRSDQSVEASGTSPLTESYTVKASSPSAGISGFRLEVLPDKDRKMGAGRSKDENAQGEPGNFVLTEFNVKVQSADGAESRIVPLSNATADFSQKSWAIEAALDGKRNTGWGVAPQTKRRHVAVFECPKPLTLAAGEKLVFTLGQEIGSQHTIARFRLSVTASPSPLKATLLEDAVTAAWKLAPENRTDRQKAALADYFRDEIDPEAKKLRKLIEEHAKAEPKYPATKAAILAEREKPRTTHVHLRGDFLSLGDRVEPGVPGVLHAFVPRAQKPDRLDLTRWLMDERNPLTARVAVNHIWKDLFGQGIVASADDFGLRGEKPTHPELLDWLATEFPRLGWSRKALIKLIVTSATYRQSSAYRTDLAERDPLNTWLARQNRLRLEAENVRDTNLAVSGLLAEKIGGPSVRPPLPAEVAALFNSPKGVQWVESEGEDRYRRGMYVFFQRTVPYPMLMAFDAPDSNQTCVRRDRSNTPLQALTLLNDPVFFECARALGKKVMGETTLNRRIRRAFELCLARLPDRAELSRMRRFYEHQKDLISEHPGNAASILGPGGAVASPADAVAQASLVATVRIIMNLDEFITRE